MTPAKATHTPGPWNYTKIDNKKFHGFRVHEGNGGPFTHIADLHGHAPDVEANAQLIAAAPDLLAAIEAMRVAGGSAEFQTAFDRAKKLALMHNAGIAGSEAVRVD